jgi:hypothetical protein
VMRAMLEAIAPQLTRGAVVHSATIEGQIPEGQIAAALLRIQSDHKTVAIGSYPFYRPEGPGAQFVVRGQDPDAVEAAAWAVEKALESEGIVPLRIPA